MADFRPFNAVMPAPGRAPLVASPPYDVMSVAEAAALAAGRPLSFLHVTRAEIDLPDTVPVHDEQVYLQAREAYVRLRETAPLHQDAVPAYYVYSLEMAGLRQTGIVGCAAVDEYESGAVRRHEKTRRDKEDDRTRHILTVAAQTGPVFLACRDHGDLAALVAEVVGEAPLFDFAAADAVRHTAWRVPARLTPQVRAVFATIPRLYIADGHHRAAAAARARAAHRAANPGRTDDAPCNRFLAVVFPSSHLRILSYNRVIRDLGDLTPECFLERLSACGSIDPAPTPQPATAGYAHLYLRGRWWRLRFQAAAGVCSAIERLDASRLQNLVLGPLLGITDPRADERLSFVGGIRGTATLERAVDSGAAALAVTLFPTSMEQLLDVADADEIMPPKSTWFEPKLRDGLFVHEI